MPARQHKSSLETIFTEELKQPITEEKSSTLGYEDIEMVDVYENNDDLEDPSSGVQKQENISEPPCILENSENKIAISIPSVATKYDENRVNYTVI